MAQRAVAWVLNLDAELELMDPAHGASARLQAETRERARWLVPAIRHATGEDVIVLGGERDAGWPPPARGDCWCPTPSALARLRTAGVARPDAPPVAVLRRVNHRAFAANLARDHDALALPDAGFETTVAACLTRVAAAPERAWVLKRPFGFSGRMRKVVVPARLDRADRTWIEASMSSYGIGLEVEPLVARTADFSLHGRIRADGSVDRGGLVALGCDERGRFVDARLASPGELPNRDAQGFDAAFDRVAAALRDAGYFGPFGIDGFSWRDERGTDRFHPLSEINARYSMAWWTGMARGHA